MSDTRIAVIAGGSGALGAAIARRLGAEGMAVYVGFNSQSETADAIAADIREQGGQSEVLALNSEKGADETFEEIYREKGRLDILVNCAGINREAPALGMDDETWEAVRAVNLDQAFQYCRAAAKYMLLGRWGRIINISSVAASFGGRGQINYAASKGGLESMTRVLALELGRKGINANCIAPGVIESDMSARLRAEHGDAVLDTIAVRRFGLPEDVASAAAFLVSEGAAYITGQTIRVDGGMGL